MKNSIALRSFQICAVIAGVIYCLTCISKVNAMAEQERYENPEKEVPAQVYIYEEVVYQQPVAYQSPVEDGFVAHEIPLEYQESGGDFPEDLQEFTYLQCEQNNVPYSLIVAMIEVESGYNNDAVSNCGAVGYMQVIEKWHKDRMAAHGYDNLSDAEANIAVGIDYMAELLSKYDMEQAVVVYNMGSPVVKSSSYSRAVMKRKAELEVEFD